MIISPIFTPATVVGQIYKPHVTVAGPGLRAWVPWMIIATAIRVGLLMNWGDKGWHDAATISWVAAVIYFNMEYWYYKTVLTSQYVTSVGLDATAVAWMLLARGAVTGA
jgi:hypothetical protein